MPLPYQPTRSRVTETDYELQFLSAPLRFNRHFFPFRRDFAMTQLILYSWARSLDFVQQPAIFELAEYLDLNKRIMGICVNRSLQYNPRKIRHLSNRSVVTYRFIHHLDLAYGLEWQICMWMWKHPEIGLSPERLRREFDDELTNRENGPALREEFQEIYIDEIWRPGSEMEAMESVSLTSWAKEKDPAIFADENGVQPPEPEKTSSLINYSRSS